MVQDCPSVSTITGHTLSLLYITRIYHRNSIKLSKGTHLLSYLTCYERFNWAKGIAPSHSLSHSSGVKIFSIGLNIYFKPY